MSQLFEECTTVEQELERLTREVDLDELVEAWDGGEAQPLVSVIVPSLNVAGYIDECLLSVTGQTVPYIEIICVDADSDDGTLEKIRAHAERDPRIKVLVSDKRSFGYQMNLGMQHARGVFMGIVEADDCADEAMFEAYLRADLQNGGLDFVKSDFQRFEDTAGGRAFTYRSLTNKIACYGKVLSPKDDPTLTRLNNLCQPGIYRMDFLRENGIRYNESPGASYQDNGFWFQVFARASRALFLREPHYCKRHDNPASSVHSTTKVFEMCDEYDFIHSIIAASEQTRPFLPWCALRRHQNYSWRLKALPEWTKPAFFQRWADDFGELEAAGELDRTLFKPREWLRLRAIMAQGSDYYFTSSEGAHALDDRTEKLKSARTVKAVKSSAAYKVGNALTRPLRAVRRSAAGHPQFKGLSVSAAGKQVYRESRDLPRERYAQYLRWLFEKKGCGQLNLDAPASFDEKVQWYKLNVLDRPLYARLADKLAVRDWVAARVGERYLTMVYGPWDNFDAVDFAALPESFALKTNHGSGMVYLVPDKGALDAKDAKAKLDAWLDVDFAFVNGFELQYAGIKARVYAEEFLADAVSRPQDYKFWCFGGQVAFVQYLSGSGRDRRISFFDPQWNVQPFNDNKPFHEQLPARPAHLEEMVEVATELSRGFQFVRVDLYETDGGVRFGEMTFTPASGFCKWDPPEANYMMGDLWVLDPDEGM